jgi:uncharacterized protein (UPF0335 family)
MTNLNSLLRAWAQSIDDLDGQISALNDDKKIIYASARESLSPADFKAWRDAVRLRQKRAKNRDEMEAHDELVDHMLFVLENPLTVVENDDTRARPQAHDPVTGEVVNG